MKKYDDIIHLEHHQSSVHARMTMEDRAAQFSPFSALTGYEDAIDEAKRITDTKVELDENEMEGLNMKLKWIQEHLEEHPEVELIYFEPDLWKEGGEYQRIRGKVKRIDEVFGYFLLENGKKILIEQIMEIGLE